MGRGSGSRRLLPRQKILPQGHMKVMGDTALPEDRRDRARLHMRCAVACPRNAGWHLAGIFREYVAEPFCRRRERVWRSGRSVWRLLHAGRLGSVQISNEREERTEA